ncbi:arabinan endo-1,5-alpha-L-arabinosidase [Wenyingzhuangia sp. IMCC45467]
MMNLRNILAYILLIVFVLYACSSSVEDVENEIEEIVEPEIEEEIVAFRGPTYPDNYASTTAWTRRYQWNLTNVHDPTVEKDGDYYYMYQTDASYGNAHDGHGHFLVRRSKDLVKWDFRGAVFQQAPLWIKDSLNNKRARMIPALPTIENPNYGFWAPYIKKVGEKFRLYYSVVVTNPIVGTSTNNSWTERAFIGLAESDNLESNVWEDKGMVICSEPDGKETYVRENEHDWSGYFKFNAIDPTMVITPNGEHWLIYGSWHSGTAAVQLNPETGKPYKLSAIEDYGVRIAGRGDVNTNRWQALEGPEIIYNEDTGYYYLFLAYDELSVAYNTRVARSRNVTGPYVGMDGGNITTGADCWPMLTHPYQFKEHTGWVGFSHCSVFQNPETQEWFYASQARLPENVYNNPYSNALMMGHVRKIQWTEDGWPIVAPQRYAGVPQKELTDASFVGEWEQITMNYQYRVMQTSSDVYLSANHTVSGAVTGSWSYNDNRKELTINNNKYKVENAWDWEANPRIETITYAGFVNSGMNTIWAKKVN